MDAQTLSAQSRTVAAVYMAGYAVECYLKAYLQKAGRRFPTHGAAGHNLHELWRAAGFRLSDLRDLQGNRSYFITQWSTDLRYNEALNIDLDADVLVSGARQLAGWIQGQLRRLARRSR
jgi:HEPN domain-containing protein